MGRRKQRGNALLEFALCFVFLVPLLTGMVGTGVLLTRSVQTAQISRDAGYMFARYVDFSLSGNQQIIVHLADGLGMTQTGGNGVVILTQIMYVDDAQCTGAGFTAATCPNYHQNVILKRITIGNAGLRTSSFGTPTAALLQTDGSIHSPTYLTDSTCLVPNTASVPVMAGGDFAYVSEAFFSMSDLVLPYFNAGGNTYAFSMF